jgi:hypothetical protein
MSEDMEKQTPEINMTELETVLRSRIGVALEQAIPQQIIPVSEVFNGLQAETDTLPEPQLTTKQELNAARDFKNFLTGLSDDTVITFTGADPENHIVYIDNFKYYPDLLKIACECINLPPNMIKATAQRLVKHESQHYKTIKDNPNINSQFGVAFFYNVETGEPGFIPTIKSWGEFTVGLLRQYIEGAKMPSGSDLVKRGIIS